MNKEESFFSRAVNRRLKRRGELVEVDVVEKKRVDDSNIPIRKRRAVRNASAMKKIKNWYQHPSTPNSQETFDTIHESDIIAPGTPELAKQVELLHRTTTALEQTADRHASNKRRPRKGKQLRARLFQKQYAELSKPFLSGGDDTLLSVDDEIDLILAENRRKNRMPRASTTIQSYWRMYFRRKVYLKYKARATIKLRDVFIVWRLSFRARKLNRGYIQRAVFGGWLEETQLASKVRQFEMQAFNEAVASEKSSGKGGAPKPLPSFIVNLFCSSESFSTNNSAVGRSEDQTGKYGALINNTNASSSKYNAERSMHEKMRQIVTVKVMRQVWHDWKRYLDKKVRQQMDAQLCLKRAVRLVFTDRPVWNTEKLMTILQMWHRYTVFTNCRKKNLAFPTFATPLFQWDIWLQEFRNRQLRRLKASAMHPVAKVRRYFRHIQDHTEMYRYKYRRLLMAKNHYSTSVTTSAFLCWRTNAICLKVKRERKVTAFRTWYIYFARKARTRPKKRLLQHRTMLKQLALVWKNWDVAYLRTSMIKKYKISVILESRPKVLLMQRMVYAWHSSFKSQFLRWRLFLSWKSYSKRRIIWKKYKFYGAKCRRVNMLSTQFYAWKRFYKTNGRISSLPSVNGTTMREFQRDLSRILPDLETTNKGLLQGSMGSFFVLRSNSVRRMSNIREGRTGIESTTMALHRCIKALDPVGVANILSSKDGTASVMDTTGSTNDAALHVAVSVANSVLLSDEADDRLKAQSIFSIIAYLLEFGADLQQVNSNGNTPYSLAEKNSDIKLLFASHVECQQSTDKQLELDLYQKFYRDSWGQLESSTVWSFCIDWMLQISSGQRRCAVDCGIANSFLIERSSSGSFSGDGRMALTLTPNSAHARSVMKRKSFQYCNENNLNSLSAFERHDSKVELVISKNQNQLTGRLKRDSLLLGEAVDFNVAFDPDATDVEEPAAVESEDISRILMVASAEGSDRRPNSVAQLRRMGNLFQSVSISPREKPINQAKTLDVEKVVSRAESEKSVNAKTTKNHILSLVTSADIEEVRKEAERLKKLCDDYETGTLSLQLDLAEIKRRDPFLDIPDGIARSQCELKLEIILTEIEIYRYENAATAEDREEVFLEKDRIMNDLKTIRLHYSKERAEAEVELEEILDLEIMYEKECICVLEDSHVKPLIVKLTLWEVSRHKRIDASERIEALNAKFDEISTVSTAIEFENFSTIPKTEMTLATLYQKKQVLCASLEKYDSTRENLSDDDRNLFDLRARKLKEKEEFLKSNQYLLAVNGIIYPALCDLLVALGVESDDDNVTSGEEYDSFSDDATVEEKTENVGALNRVPGTMSAAELKAKFNEKREMTDKLNKSYTNSTSELFVAERAKRSFNELQSAQQQKEAEETFMEFNPLTQKMEGAPQHLDNANPFARKVLDTKDIVTAEEHKESSSTVKKKFVNRKKEILKKIDSSSFSRKATKSKAKQNTEDSDPREDVLYIPGLDFEFGNFASTLDSTAMMQPPPEKLESSEQQQNPEITNDDGEGMWKSMGEKTTFSAVEQGRLPPSKKKRAAIFGKRRFLSKKISNSSDSEQPVNSNDSPLHIHEEEQGTADSTIASVDPLSIQDRLKSLENLDCKEELNVNSRLVDEEEDQQQQYSPRASYEEIGGQNVNQLEDKEDRRLEEEPMIAIRPRRMIFPDKAPLLRTEARENKVAESRRLRKLKREKKKMMTKSGASLLKMHSLENLVQVDTELRIHEGSEVTLMPPQKKSVGIPETTLYRSEMPSLELYGKVALSNSISTPVLRKHTAIPGKLKFKKQYRVLRPNSSNDSQQHSLELFGGKIGSSSSTNTTDQLKDFNNKQFYTTAPSDDEDDSGDPLSLVGSTAPSRIVERVARKLPLQPPVRSAAPARPLPPEEVEAQERAWGTFMQKPMSGAVEAAYAELYPNSNGSSSSDDESFSEEEVSLHTQHDPDSLDVAFWMDIEGYKSIASSDRVVQLLSPRMRQNRTKAAAEAQRRRRTIGKRIYSKYLNRKSEYWRPWMASYPRMEDDIRKFLKDAPSSLFDEVQDIAHRRINS